MSGITLAANTQPIYPRDIIHWRQPLKDEVVPRIPTTQVPVLVGTAGDNGAIIHNISVMPLGNNIATVVRLFTQSAINAINSTSLQSNYHLELELSIPATSGASDTAALTPLGFTLPSILPSGNGNKALHLVGGESLFAALGTAIATGLILYVRGGNY